MGCSHEMNPSNEQWDAICYDNEHFIKKYNTVQGFKNDRKETINIKASLK